MWWWTGRKKQKGKRKRSEKTYRCISAVCVIDDQVINQTSISKQVSSKSISTAWGVDEFRLREIQDQTYSGFGCLWYLRLPWLDWGWVVGKAEEGERRGLVWVGAGQEQTGIKGSGGLGGREVESEQGSVYLLAWTTWGSAGDQRLRTVCELGEMRVRY